MIVAETPYETSDPTVDSQMVRLKASGADVFFNVTTPKFAAQAIKKAAEIGWQPVHLLNNVSQSVGSVLQPAGLENAKGIYSSYYLKDQNDPQWKDDPAMKDWRAFMDKYFPDGDKTSSFTVYGYAVAQTMAQVLKQCGDELTRENVMRQAANLKSRHRRAPAGHQDQHQPDRLLSDRADADAALQRRALGIDRRGDERRGRRVGSIGAVIPAGSAAKTGSRLVLRPSGTPRRRRARAPRLTRGPPP